MLRVSGPLSFSLLAAACLSFTHCTTPAFAEAIGMPIATPTPPTISGSVDDGDPSLQGKAQAVTDAYPKQSKIYVCVWNAPPANDSLDCRAATSNTSKTKPASLSNSDNTADGSYDYVLANAADGTFTATLVSPLKGGQYVSLVELATPAAGAEQPITSSEAVVVKSAASGTTSSLYTLGLVGANSTGTSASGPTLQYFVSFDTMVPIGGFFSRKTRQKGDKAVPKVEDDCPKTNPTYPLCQQWWVWLSPRIASAPAPTSAALSSYSSPTSLTSSVGGQTISQITQTFEFQGGLEFDLNPPWRGKQFGMGKSWGKNTIAVVLAVGGSTPFNPVSTASEYSLNKNLGTQFTNNPSLAKTYPFLAQALCNVYDFTSKPPCKPSSATYKNVAFVFPDRSRFYRNYSAGFRLRTYYFTGLCKIQASHDCMVDNTYPGTFDIRFGQDETVTGGHLQSVIMTFAGTYPLPGTSGTIRIFGASFLAIRKNQNTIALAVLPTVPVVPITDPSVVIQPIRPGDQDYYRLGIGVDLIPLIAKWINNSSKTSTPANLSPQ